MHSLGGREIASCGAAALALVAGVSYGVVFLNGPDNPMVATAGAYPSRGETEMVAVEHLANAQPVAMPSAAAANQLPTPQLAPPNGLTAPEGCTWTKDPGGNVTLVCSAPGVTPTVPIEHRILAANLPPSLTTAGCVRVNDANGNSTLLCPEPGVHGISLRLPSSDGVASGDLPTFHPPEGCMWVTDGFGVLMLYCPDPGESGAIPDTSLQAWTPPPLPPIQTPAGCWWVTNGTGAMLLLCPPSGTAPFTPTIPELRTAPDGCVWIADGLGHTELLCLPTEVTPSPDAELKFSTPPELTGTGAQHNDAQHVAAGARHGTTGIPGPLVGAALAALAAGGGVLRRRDRVANRCGESPAACD